MDYNAKTDFWSFDHFRSGSSNAFARRYPKRPKVGCQTQKKGSKGKFRQHPRIRKCQSLTKDFFMHFNAAGIGRIYGSQSGCRRFAWCITVCLTAFLMIYMTYKVTSEYFEYKKTVETTTVIISSMDFPAVTVCSPIMLPKSRINRAHKEELYRLENFTREIEEKSSSKDERLDCNQDPVCQWSWFEGRCVCGSNPCQTEYCDDTSPSCYCSSMVCENHTDICRMGATGQCFCENRNFKKTDEKDVPKANNSVLDAIQDKEVASLIASIRDSDVDDLSDVQGSFQPDLYNIAEFGASYDNLIFGCTFQKQKCDQNNFTLFYTSSHGKCYTFNYVGEQARTPGRPLETRKYGGSSGLQLYLQIREDEILDLLNKDVGVIVVVHDARELPYVSEYGLTIRVGDSASLRVQKLRNNRLGEPWGKCLWSGSHLPFNYTDQPYSQLGCQRYCQNYYVSKKCNCHKRSLIPTTVARPRKDQTKICNYTNYTERICSDGVIESIENETIKCDCFQACKETIYQTSLTSGRINKNYFRLVKASKTLRYNGTGFSAAFTSQKNNILALKVYYGTLSLQNTTERPAYSWETLISNIGGNLGFFMGLTLITFFEVAELICDLLVFIARKVV